MAGQDNTVDRTGCYIIQDAYKKHFWERAQDVLAHDKDGDGKADFLTLTNNPEQYVYMEDLTDDARKVLSDLKNHELTFLSSTFSPSNTPKPKEEPIKQPEPPQNFADTLATVPTEKLAGTLVTAVSAPFIGPEIVLWEAASQTLEHYTTDDPSANDRTQAPAMAAGMTRDEQVLSVVTGRLSNQAQVGFEQAVDHIDDGIVRGEFSEGYGKFRKGEVTKIIEKGEGLVAEMDKMGETAGAARVRSALLSFKNAYSKYRAAQLRGGNPHSFAIQTAFSKIQALFNQGDLPCYRGRNVVKLSQQICEELATIAGKFGSEATEIGARIARAAASARFAEEMALKAQKLKSFRVKAGIIGYTIIAGALAYLGWKYYIISQESK